MASEAVKKILEAEALSDKKNAEARRQRDDIISSASGKSSLAIQKRLSDAHSELSKLKSDYDKKLEEYKKNAEVECQKKIDSIRQQAEKNMGKAVDEIINRYF
jgi:vacuolar-type H+-ATPase subunit H